MITSNLIFNLPDFPYHRILIIFPWYSLSYPEFSNYSDISVPLHVFSFHLSSSISTPVLSHPHPLGPCSHFHSSWKSYSSLVYCSFWKRLFTKCYIAFEGTHRRAHLALVLAAGAVVGDHVMLFVAQAGLGGGQGVRHDQGGRTMGRWGRTAAGTVGPVQSTQRTRGVHPPIFHPCKERKNTVS